jgi:CO dehydrogenase nickel-insertion accessory protein CooC1
MKTLVNCNEQDDIRIVRAGGAGAVTIAASRALAMADVFRWMFVNEDWDLSLFEESGGQVPQRYLGGNP